MPTNVKLSDKRLEAPVADLTAIKGINVAGIDDGVLVLVRTLGIYQYSSGSSLPNDDNLVIAPTLGIGRWLLVQLGFTNKGNWNASTNTPTLSGSVGNRGDYYLVSVAGTTSLDGISSWLVGDKVVFDGKAWAKVDDGTAMVNVSDAEITRLLTVGTQFATNTGPSYPPVILTNPLTRWIFFDPENGNFKTMRLPIMNATNSAPVGQIFTIQNVSSFIGVVNYQDGTSFIATLYPGMSVTCLVTSNSTANGTFQIIETTTNFAINASYTWGGASSALINTYITQINNLITISVQSISITSNQSAIIQLATVIPTIFQPAQSVVSATTYNIDSSLPSTLGRTIVDTSGVVFVESAAGGNISATTSILVNSFSVSYRID